MDSIAAHMLILSTVEHEEGAPPSLWCHHRRTGSLSVAFPGSSNSYTWSADAVAEMATRWRADPSPSPAAVALEQRWEMLETLLSSEQLTPPDEVIVDHDADEFRLVWEEEKLVVVIGD